MLLTECGDGSEPAKTPARTVCYGNMPVRWQGPKATYHGNIDSPQLPVRLIRNVMTAYRPWRDD